MKLFSLVTMCLALALTVGCASNKGATLYDELGGNAGVTAVVDGFLDEIAGDDRVVAFFDETDIDRFREKLIEQICNVSGGPCEYTGDTMVEVHKGMEISEAHFNAIVEDLIHAMENVGVSTPAQNKLLALLAPMHDDIRFADER